MEEIRPDIKESWPASTFDIVSTTAYLIGVSKKIFELDYEPPQIEVFTRLELEKPARIIRHLCIIRTEIERHFKAINDTMRFEYRSILNMPEYVPADSIRKLTEDGVTFFKKNNTKLWQHVAEINRIIQDRINNCRSLYPVWLNWRYIHDLFIMPQGVTDQGTSAAAEAYYAHLDGYPYRQYINWMPGKDEGNILYNDRKFVTLLYEHNRDRFTQMNLVSDADAYVKTNIYDFIEDSKQLVVVVDCENSDPYRLCATFQNLDIEYTQKINRIILFDDVHTVDAWKTLEQYTSIPVEHRMIERVKDDKSLVDIMLTATASKEHYKNGVDAFIIVSSDSDYWGLISTLDEAKFLVMIEREKCGPDLKKALLESGIFYCYIDDFYSGNSEDIRNAALFREMYRYIDDTVKLNIYEMFDTALYNTRIHMNEAEKKQFIARYIKTIRMTIEDDGDLKLEFKR